MNVLYFDCFSGAAGDMILGALLDAGCPQSPVRASLDALRLDGWEMRVSPTSKSGLRATKVDVILAEEDTGRTYNDIVKIVRDAALSDEIKSRALAIFQTLARAEGHVHGVAAEEVQFHEAGSLDSIIDIVGTCAALEHYMPARVITSPMATGIGTAQAAHGTIPLPAPAVAEIVADRGAPIVGAGDIELLTPTGAAILATVSDEFGSPPPMVVDRVGYGAGTDDLVVANVLRVFVGSQVHDDATAVVMEANIDDMSPELLPDIVELLVSAGAQDAWLTPIVMKKGRPAFTLGVLCGLDRSDEIRNMIFRETSTLGVRSTPVTKNVLERHWVDANVEGMTVRVKIGRHGSRQITAAPEHDDAVAVARATGLPLRRVYELALADVAANSLTPPGDDAPSN
jgi:pyridinium-3,5-bisthiocarboxylic acid mononucleotide nickel chelatase